VLFWGRATVMVAETKATMAKSLAYTVRIGTVVAARTLKVFIGSLRWISIKGSSAGELGLKYV